MKLEGLNISKNYGNYKTLENVSVDIQKGEILGVLGDNGSGKSTLLSIMAGIKKYDNGRILCNGEEVTKKTRLKIGYVPQEPTLFEYLTVKENIELWCGVYKIKFADCLELAEFLEVDSLFKKKVSMLSGGMKKKISILIALMNSPDFLIMDEAFAALDSKIIDKLINYLKTNKNLGVLYSSHNIYEIIELCDRIIVIKDAGITYSTNEKLEFADVSEIYSKF